ncbi:MAG: helix-turn-helix domain-containing protein [Candidatus Alcyoniella australis]|nr:helix-turn-helix domain-containing protein [Candidatus Alcyoniella australis]
MSSVKQTTPIQQAQSLEQLVEPRLRKFVNQAAQCEGNGLYGTVIQCVERPLIRAALDQCLGNQVAAAKLLGIHRNTLRRKIKDLDLEA